MFLSSLSIKRPVMVSMGLLAFLVFGIMAYFSLTLDMMPEVEIGVVTVQTIYPGAGPKEIEMQISKKIEDAVATVSKIDVLQSYSMEGVSFVTVRFKIGKDPDIANQEIKDKVNAILNDLPKDAHLPVVQKFDIGAFPIVEMVLTGKQSMTQLYEIADKQLKDRLSQIEGVARVNITGGEKREIRVELDNRVVFQNSISLPQLAQILAVQNLDMPGGHFQQRSQEYSVRLKGEFDRVETINNLEIPTSYGVKKVGQLAKVRDTGAEVRERTIYFDNINKIRENHVVLLSVLKSSGGNTVAMAKLIKKELPAIEQDLPAGSHLTLVRDASLFIESSVEDTLSNIIMGIILTSLVLLFFLHDLRSA
ncbi:MAG TPA: efflux RND transporter permease subunit, partial [Bacteroidetes bacterium]|nr:efflux RND transporter permease subunit [Bacteroidota bacterium]